MAWSACSTWTEVEVLLSNECDSLWEYSESHFCSMSNLGKQSTGQLLGMDVGNVLQLTHSFGYVQKGAGMEWTSRAELMTWHHWKSRWLDDLIPKKSPAFFCLKSTCCSRSGTRNRTAGGGRAISDGYSQEAPRGGVWWWRSLPRDMRKSKKKGQLMSCEKIVHGMAMYSYFHANFDGSFYQLLEKNTWHLTWWLNHVASVTKVNVDSNTVGWYQTTHLGQSETSETVEVQMSYGNMVWMGLIINVLSKLYITGQCVIQRWKLSFFFMFVVVLILFLIVYWYSHSYVWSYDDVLLFNFESLSMLSIKFPFHLPSKDRLTIRAGVSVIIDGACRFINKDVIHSQRQTQLQENHQDRQTIKGRSVSWNWFPGFQWFDFAILSICK